MTPRHRQPPLFEALGDSARRADPGQAGAAGVGGEKAAANGRIIHPPVVGDPSAHGSQPSSNGQRPAAEAAVRLAGPASAGPSWAKNRSTMLLFLLAALIGLFAVVWTFAYRIGHDQGQQSVLSHTETRDAAVITGQMPNKSANEPLIPLPSAGTVRSQSVQTPQKAPGTAPAASTGKPTPGMPPVVGPDSRRAGANYLEIVELTWRDAEPAVRFLQAGGVRATSFPIDRKVDPAKMEPNNRVRIFVDQPYASGDEFRSSQSERSELVALIRRLGKKWQSEHKGASDFQEPMWRLQRGK